MLIWTFAHQSITVGIVWRRPSLRAWYAEDFHPHIERLMLQLQIPKQNHRTSIHQRNRLMASISPCCKIVSVSPRQNPTAAIESRQLFWGGGVESSRRRLKRSGRKRDNKKRRKLLSRFIVCHIPAGIYCWGEELLNEYYLVIDGAAMDNRTCIVPSSCEKEWMCCSIRSGHLFVPALCSPSS